MHFSPGCTKTLQATTNGRPKCNGEAGESYRREKHKLVAHDQALEASEKTGLPAIVPPFIYPWVVRAAASPTLWKNFILWCLVAWKPRLLTKFWWKKAILGWKEFEMEVVRDKADNCIIICSIENIDPMGIHTADSMTVAPALTLSDKEFQVMRNASIAVLREIGVRDRWFQCAVRG